MGVIYMYVYIYIYNIRLHGILYKLHVCVEKKKRRIMNKKEHEQI